MRCYLLLLFVSLHFFLFAQEQTPQDTLRTLDIAPITVSASRFEAQYNSLPFAISVLNKSQIQRAQAQLSLNESLVAVPGVFTLNPDNFSQDLRISIRGFGARAAFGIRGIRLFVDGLPESTPDGQADVDNVDAGALQRMELLRGASAGLYGNASGGVLNFSTEEPSKKAFAESQAILGSFGFQRYQVKTGFMAGKLGVFASASQNRMEGYRAQSAMQQTTLNLKLRYQLSDNTRLSLLLNYGKSPYAEDAGGLTSEQVSADRRQARAANVQFNAGEEVTQGRIGLVFEKQFSTKHSLSARTFLTNRDFANRLAFQGGGWVEFQRSFGGVGITYAYTSGPYRSQVGLEWNDQQDDRQRYNNDNGKRGNQTFDQIEKFRSTGAFWLNELALGKKLTLTAATRYDALRLSSDDVFLSDGNQSGEQNFDRFNPSVGAVFVANKWANIYANVASNFETPTLTELSANPNNLGGFNPDLKPQRSLNYELGTKLLINDRLGLDLALFQINLQDELVPYQLATAPGRTFFRNAGKSLRKGIEAALNLRLEEGLYLTLNYTYSDFSYQDYTANGTSFAGNAQPAVPKHHLFSILQWAHRSGFFIAAQARSISKVFVNDANSATAAGSTLASMRVGHTFQLGKQWRIEPFAGINNIFGTEYTGNILLNAVGNRFYEPGVAQATYYGGVKLSWKKN